MTFNEAKRVLIIHGTGTSDSNGEPACLEEGFLGSLRPYRGLMERNFHIVMEALLAAGETIHREPQVDRELVDSLWSMCSLARHWGLHPEGMLQRNHLITKADAERLEVWIEAIERTAQGLLNGSPPHLQITPYAQYVIDFGWWDNIDAFIPFFQRAVSDPEADDGIESVVPAIGKLGGRARSVLPILREALTRNYNWYSPGHKCTQEARGIIRAAIRNIEAGSELA